MNLLCGISTGLAQVALGGVEDRPLSGAWSTRPSLPTVRTPQAQGLPGALPERGLTVWAAVAALLARRGGRAMGEGGPVPTPLRGAPAPIPGEA